MSASFFAPSDAFVSAFPLPPRLPREEIETVRPEPGPEPEFSWPKSCGCGRTHTAEAWPSLPYCGVQKGDSEVADLQLRHCPCGSTLAVPVDSVLETLPEAS